MCVSEIRVLVHDTRQSEISKLHVFRGVKEYVARFQVSVKDLSILSVVAGA